jgi:hypothetical protein
MEELRSGLWSVLDRVLAGRVVDDILDLSLNSWDVPTEPSGVISGQVFRNVPGRVLWNAVHIVYQQAEEGNPIPEACCYLPGAGSGRVT